jgi:hypothetical protein
VRVARICKRSSTMSCPERERRRKKKKKEKKEKIGLVTWTNKSPI